MVSNWLKVITPMSVELLRDMVRESKLPPLSDYMKLFSGPSLTPEQVKSHKNWQMYQSLCDLELNALGLLFSVLNTDNLDDMCTIMGQIPIDLLVFRFKLCWAASTFKPLKHSQKFLSGGYEASDENMVKKFEYLCKAPHSLIHYARFKYENGTSNNKHTLSLASTAEEESDLSKGEEVWSKINAIATTPSAFVPDRLPIDEETKDILMRAWIIQKHLCPDQTLSVSFAYFQFLESLCSESLDDIVHKSNMSSGEMLHYNKHYAIWNRKREVWNERSSTSLVSEAESEAFMKYFGSIEILLENGRLSRVYFPIPGPCRKQMNNPLVEKEMTLTLESVSRDSPEERLDDFLDRMLQVKDMINFQDKMLEEMPTRHITKFITKKESWWVLITLGLSLYINGIVLMYAAKDFGRHNQFLGADNLQRLRPAMIIHLIMAIVLVINFCLGSAMVTINRGLSWRRNVRSGAVVLNVSGPTEALYDLCDTVLPDAIWACVFLLMDFQMLYYAAFLVSSILGNVYSVAFFSFHMLDVAVRIKLLGYVLKSVYVNIFQVLTTLLLGIFVLWIYTVLGIYVFGFSAYEFPNMPDTDYQFKDDVVTTFWKHLDFGLNGSPLFNEYGEDGAAKYIFDISYQIFIVVIMVAIITGIIIDTFADLRSERNDIEDDMNNKCFICSLGREVFERNRIKFRDHTDKHHATWNYLFYSMYLSNKKSTELTGIERWMQKQISSQSTAYFPINRAMCLPEEEERDSEVALTDLHEAFDALRSFVTKEVETQRESMETLKGEVIGNMTKIIKAIDVHQKQKESSTTVGMSKGGTIGR